ncbi:Organic cation transporter protein [Lamellibrachia satsuma]|nr:Organic cation transporter protein [Lamellibrachia satsuma]
MDPDEALSSLGNPWRNPWQMIMYNLIIVPMGITTSWQMMAIVFVGGDPTHQCRLPVTVSVYESAPYEDVEGERRYHSCAVYENYSSATNRTIPCPLGWEYEHDSFTITEQWDLVCDKNFWTDTTQTVLVFGVLVGAMIMTPIADKFGRKRTFLMNACASSVVVFVTALINNYYVFTALRFLLGIFLQTNKKQTTVSDTQEYTLVDIMTSSTLRLYTFVLFYLWFVVCLVYYGLSLSSGTLAGNKYVNFCLSGAVEIPAILLSIPLYNRIGRRWPMCVLLITSGISLLITLVIPQTTDAVLSAVSVAFSLIGKFSITAAFSGIFLYTPELYPTTVRNVGLGMGSVGGRLGNMVAPYSTYFTRLAPWFPGVVFGTLSVIGGGMTLLLPETHDRPLPQTLEEAENRAFDTRKAKREAICDQQC